MLIRVFEIPPPTGNFHFGQGENQTFVEVDWFRDDDGMMNTSEGRGRIREFVEGKRYIDPQKSYLILHPEHSMTINYQAS